MKLDIQKTVKEFEDYKVCGRGFVYSYKQNPPLRLKNIIQSTGYYTVTLTNTKRRAVKYVHHMVMEAFGKDRPSPTHVINHIDPDRSNCSISNLRWIPNSHIDRGSKPIIVQVYDVLVDKTYTLPSVTMASSFLGISTSRVLKFSMANELYRHRYRISYILE